MGIASIIFIILTIILFVLMRESLDTMVRFRYNEDGQTYVFFFILSLVATIFFLSCRFYGTHEVIQAIKNTIKVINGG